MLCSFAEDELGTRRCVACRRPAPRGIGRDKRISRTCSGRACPHLGPPFANESGDGAAEVMVPCGCGGNANKERPATVFECRLFTDADGDPGECLPYWRPSDKQRQQYESRPDAIRLCDGCGRGVESGAWKSTPST